MISRVWDVRDQAMSLRRPLGLPCIAVFVTFVTIKIFEFKRNIHNKT